MRMRRDRPSPEGNREEVVVEHGLGVAVHPAQVLALLAPAAARPRSRTSLPSALDLHVHAAQQPRAVEARHERHRVERRGGSGRSKTATAPRSRDGARCQVAVPRRPRAGPGLDRRLRRAGRSRGRRRRAPASVRRQRPAHRAQRVLECLRRRQVGGDGGRQDPGHVLARTAPRRAGAAGSAGSARSRAARPRSSRRSPR